MGFRTRSATPGTLLCLAATVLLAVVSFNTPLLKSLYFLQANFSAGEYSGQLNLGTLGYCLNDQCVGPQVGYEFNPNTIFNVSVFNIPTAITKYLTYALIIHIVALGCAVLATIFGLLSHISSLSVLCFPTCFASMASTFSLVALVFDLVIFYIAKARIDDVSGASASIGISVWLTLAAWLVSGIGGCAYGVGRCCVNRRGERSSGDTKANYYANQNQPDDMRLQALRDEQTRKKEQGLPSFQELERTPLRDDQEDKYLYEDRDRPTGLARDGSVLQGVGMGYGKRNGNSPGQANSNGGYGGYPVNYNNLKTPPSIARRDSVTSSAGPGAAGVGAGGQGVEPVNNQYGRYNEDGYYDQGHMDQYHDPYGQNQQYGDYNNHAYPPSGTIPIPQPNLARRPSDPYDPYAAGDMSMESAYSSTAPPVQHADPYGGYDDGLGAIGRAATTVPEQSHSRDYTGGSYTYNDNQYNSQPYGTNSSDPYANPAPYGSNPPIQVPTPQHLTTHNSAQDLLRSPISPPPQNGYAGGQYDRYGHEDQGSSNRPPSYGSVTGVPAPSNQYPNEKSQYR